MSWQSPIWLILGLYPVMHMLIRWALANGKQSDYADAALLPWVRSLRKKKWAWCMRWRVTCFTLAWIFFAITLAGPQIAETVYYPHKDDFSEIIVVLDLSRSMTAQDILPDRLQRAKLELNDLVQRARNVKIGLVVFAARPHLFLPPTDDKAVLLHQINSLRHGLLPTDGSDLFNALVFSARQFSPDSTARYLLLVSDGETANTDATAEQVLDEFATTLSQTGTKLYALGMGTGAGAPLFASDGGWLTDQGVQVVSQLQHERLQRIATLGNGRYTTVSDSNADWQLLYDNGIGQVQINEAAGQENALVVWYLLYPWFLLPAVFFFLLAYVRSPQSGVAAMGIAPLLLIIWLSGVVFSPISEATENAEEQAFQAYTAGDYDRARLIFSRIRGIRGRLGEGSSFYRLGDYTSAIRQYTLAVLAANNDEQRASALFNLANSHYQLEDYATAVEYYGDVLRYQPELSAANLNLAFAKAQLDKIDKQPASGSARPGRGSRTTRLPQGSELGGGQLVLEEEQNEQAVLHQADEVLSKDATNLLDKGAKPVSTRRTEFSDTNWRFEATAVDQIILQSAAMEVDESELWQRLFEAEEQFPAPLDEPVTIPGTRPW